MIRTIKQLEEKAEKDFKDCSSNEEYYYSAFDFYLENMPETDELKEHFILMNYCSKMLEKIEKNAFLYCKIDKTTFYKNYFEWKDKKF